MEAWVEHTREFLDRAFSMPSLVVDAQIKSPCSLCRSYVRQKRQIIEKHLCTWFQIITLGQHMARVILPMAKEV
jgi:hypothetical protein